MPWKEKETERRYWDTALVASMFSISQSKLYFWEKRFSWLNPKRIEGKKIRKYSKKDLDIIKEIHLLRVRAHIKSSGIQLAKDRGFYNGLVKFYRNALSIDPDAFPPKRAVYETRKNKP